MTHVWFALCAYLLFSVIGLLEADIRVKPGTHPNILGIFWAALLFALTHPALSAGRWIGARAERLMR